MARFDDVRNSYEKITDRLFNDKQSFVDFLNFSGRFYKLPAAQAMAIFAENPNARMAADYETWGKFNRQVKRGERGIGYISDGTVRYCFDISQTIGEAEPFQWKFDKQTAEKYKSTFAAEHEGNFSSLAQCVNYLAIDEVNSSINSIADSLHVSSKNKSAFIKSARSMVRQIIKARCEYQSAYKINTAPIDLSALDMLHSKAEFEKLCEWVQLTAKSALKKMEKSVNDIIFERSIENERQSDLERGGQEVLQGDNRGERADVQARSDNLDISAAADSELQRGGAGTAETADRELRQRMAEIHGGEFPVRDSSAGDESAVRDNSSESGQGSRGNVQSADETVGGNSPAPSNDIHGDRSMGEDEDNGMQARGNGGRGAEAQGDLNSNTAAEDNTSAASLSADTFAEENRTTYSTSFDNTEAEQFTLFDEQPEVKAESQPYFDESENPELAAAVNSLKDYAHSTILYYGSSVRESFLNGSRHEFNNEVRRAVDEGIKNFMNGENTSETDIREAYITLYKEMYENGEFAENLYTELSNMLYADHIEIDKGRQKAHELGLPYDEYPYDPEENFDPYAYNPNRMSDEDYDRMHALIDDERAEAEKLIDKTVHIEDLDYIVEGVVSNGSDGFLVKLRAEPNEKYNIASVIYEDMNVVREMLEQQNKVEKKAVVETNGDEWFIADKNDRGIILEPKEYWANSNEDFLKSVAENNPDYAEYINSHLSELAEEINHIREFLAQEAEDIEHDRLVADMASGGYGDDRADSATEQRISLLENRRALREVKPKSVDDLQIGDVIKPDLATITCEWSESSVFEEGETYSVYEFDRLMKSADDERVFGKKAALEKYGSSEAWYNAKNDDEFSRYYGYDKVKFTVNMPNGEHYTERQDIGDGYGGVIEFLSRFPKYETVIPILREAKEFERQRELDNFKAERISPLNVKNQEQSTLSERGETSENFHIEDNILGEGGQKTRYTANITAIRTLKQIEAEGRTATADEQKILSQYVGWGGMPQAFDSANDKWSKEYKELKELLTDEEYTAARGSTLNAHYTTPTVINAIYKALDNMGFKSGNVLEPAMGIGNFYGCLPEKMQKSKLYGVELDSITGRIAQQLYPNANIQIKGYEQTDFPDNFFDVAVGNVPFGGYSVADKRYDSNKFLIHDYFFAKTLDKVSPGGIIAFITSKGTLDKANSKTREYLAKRADLIGAIRLPNNAFKGNANTEVTSDIIFLQKREKMAVEMPDWCYIGNNEDGIPVNQYFLDHPEMILGKMSEDGKMYAGNNTTCLPIEGADLAEQLDKAIAKLKTNLAVKRVAEANDKDRGVIPATEDVRNFTYTLVDGKMYFRENNIMTEVEEKGVKLERMKALHELRNIMRGVITAQENHCSDGELSVLQNALNEQYDSFVNKYGNIGERVNSSVFSDDDDYNLLCALENYDSEKKTYSKSDIFTKRTIKPVTEITHVDTPQEALQVSLDIQGKVDVTYIAQLCGYTPENAIKALTDSNQIYLNPQNFDSENPYEGYEEASEYLSGNVRQKLRAAEAFAEENPIFERNVQALEKALPQTIEASEIFARIGVNWVDIEDYKQFLTDYAQANFLFQSLRRTPMGEYKIESKTADRSVAATSTYGTKRLNSFEIFERLLNNRDIVVKDPKTVYDADGSEKIIYVVNSKETRLAQDKADLMKDAFKNWLWDDPARREKYVARYNELFNSIVGREYDGSHQTFPGMSPFIQLNDHQKNAVARAKLGGNALLAHCVGAGKSFEMVAATMEKKRLGLINKACVVVPKPLVRQMASEWLRLYPEANILVAGEKDFSKDNRQKFIGRCCTGDYAAVIMSYEQFEKIPMSVEYRQQFLARELTRIEAAMNDTDDRTSIKDLERIKKSIQTKIERLLNAKTKDETLTFEQLGFDSLVVDEAHNYKNGLVVTKMSRVAGVQSTPAQKSEDILMKTQYLNEQSGYKNILFATGTPVSNSMVELYTMQRYLRPDLLQQAGFENFDDWASTFGEVVTQLEPTPDGTDYRPKKRFAKFANLPELMQMYKEFADIRTAEMLNLPVPEIEGGKPQTVLAKPNEFQQEYVKVLAARSEQIHAGNVDPHDDNMLKITSEARLLGLDARCINPAAENDPDSKVNLCIDRVMDIYDQTSEKKGVQVIFCDIAIHDKNSKGQPAFSVYNYIREELIRRGIPAEEICAAGDAANAQQRTEMFSQLNSGAKRVLLASTSKMGTGANFQQKLCALHNLDIPWKPSDLEQRLGRIVRRGNENKTVQVFNYLTEKTFDSYMMSIIVNKQKFISQIMSGKTPARTCQDVDEMVLNYSEMQAIASGDPRVKEKIELDNDVSRLRLLESEHAQRKFNLQDIAVKCEREVMQISKIALPDAQQDKEWAVKNALPEDRFEMKIGNKTYTERTRAGEALRQEILSVMGSRQSKPVGDFCGFTVSLSFDGGTIPWITLHSHNENGLTYYANTNLDSDIGNITRIENILKGGIDKRIERLNGELELAQKNLAEAERTKDAPFEYADELREKTSRLEELNKALNIERTDEVVLDDIGSSDSTSKDISPPKNNPPKRGRR